MLFYATARSQPLIVETMLNARNKILSFRLVAVIQFKFELGHDIEFLVMQRFFGITSSPLPLVIVPFRELLNLLRGYNIHNRSFSKYIGNFYYTYTLPAELISFLEICHTLHRKELRHFAHRYFWDSKYKNTLTLVKLLTEFYMMNEIIRVSNGSIVFSEYGPIGDLYAGLSHMQLMTGVAGDFLGRY